MKKVLILSDSHGLRKEILEIKERHQIKDVIHCGDSELDMDDPALNGILNVRGNCDFDGRLPNDRILDIAGLTYFVTHGHLYNVGVSLLNLSYQADENNAQVVCFGHTHVAGAEKIGNLLFINPGSIRLPRRRTEKTYAIMKWNHLEKIHVDFYTVTGELIADLSYETSLEASF